MIEILWKNIVVLILSHFFIFYVQKQCDDVTYQ